MRRPWLIALLLAAGTLALYWPVHGFDLIYFDDPLVLTDCPEVQAGLTWASLKWAWTSVVIANWHPVTNLSFLLVSQFWGVAPGAHHLANALIHAANAALLFLLLRRLTGATWRSAAAAAIFAWHPLRVESVAWIVERKDVLCAFFFLLSLWFYALRGTSDTGHVTGKGQSLSPATRHASRYYWLAWLAFLLALLSKPMAVTLPFVLLLLDVWPLNRLRNAGCGVRSWKQLVVEKIPFLALTVIFSAATYRIQHDYAAMVPPYQLGYDRCLANAIASYVAYPAQLFWPENLVLIYPFPKSYDVGETALKAALLLAISGACLMQFKRRPQLAISWCWYLGTALPIIGLVQVGSQAMADRYTYLPLIGPVVALVWTTADLCQPKAIRLVPVTTAVILSALAFLTVQQLQYWRNTVTLFEHTVAVTTNNEQALFTLGLGFEHAGDTNRAIAHYQAAKELGTADPQPRRNLAALLANSGRYAEAEQEYHDLLAWKPNDAAVRISLAGVLTAEGKAEDAIAQLTEAIRLNPDSIEGLNNLAWALASNPRAELRNGARAVTLAQRACELTKFQKTIYIGTLAAAQAEAGQFDEAVATAQRACEVAAKNGETDLRQRNQTLRELYSRHQPYHEGQK